MDKPLDELYFNWLYGQVGSVQPRDPSASYFKLLKLLFLKEFVWIVERDDNRAEDGRDLRIEFARDERIRIEDPYWMRLGCSIFELLVGLSRRLSFEDDGEPRDWFWQLIFNLGLHEFRDGRRIPPRKIDGILEDLIWRNYQPDGRGGLFPLNDPAQDQRDVEIWYQMNAYLLERD